MENYPHLESLVFYKFLFPIHNKQVFILVTITNVTWNGGRRPTLHWRHRSFMASQITGYSPDCSTTYSSEHQRKHQSSLCDGSSLVSSRFPSQRASNAENVSTLLWSILNSSPPWTRLPPFRRRYFQIAFVNEKFCILTKISLKFVPRVLIDPA